MRADFQEQVLECGQVKDKDSGESTRAHKLHITSANFTPDSFDSAQDLWTFVSLTNGSQSSSRINLDLEVTTLAKETNSVWTC